MRAGVSVICESVLDIVPGMTSLPDNIRRCYAVLAELGLVGEAELDLLNYWLEDVARISSPE
jgi:hypothetical protein